jgi:hypothetical protein
MELLLKCFKQQRNNATPASILARVNVAAYQVRRLGG